MLEITFLRHSKAGPAENDRDRVLSEEGIRLAQTRESKLGNLLRFDHVVHSDRIRTKQTACLVADLGADAPTITVPSLFGSDDDARVQAVTKVFGDIGNAPLREYHAHCKDELDSLAKEALIDLLNAMPKTAGVMRGKVLVVGHAVMLPALCLEMTQQPEHFLDVAVGECQGWRITFAGGPPKVEFIE